MWNSLDLLSDDDDDDDDDTFENQASSKASCQQVFVLLEPLTVFKKTKKET